MTPYTSQTLVDTRGPLRLGLAASLLLLICAIGWSTQARLASAVTASGEVDVASLRHPVQDPIGGSIADVAVREGQTVTAGDLLLRLDGTDLQREHDLIVAQLAEIEARDIRLAAEIRSQPLPDDRPQTQAMTVQADLFQARAETLSGQLAQVSQQQAQAEAELISLDAQRDAQHQELALINAELETQTALQARGLAPGNRTTALARDQARLIGAQAALETRATELRGRVQHLALQRESALATRIEAAQRELIEIRALRLDLETRLAEIEARLARLELRAPVSGLVHGLTIVASGAVLRPAEIAMQILPRDAAPVLALRVRPDDIDHLHIGQSARLSFPALENRGLSDLEGEVTTISAATFTDERSGNRYFRVEVALSSGSQERLGAKSLLPGMAVQAFLSTGDRTPLAYLLSPVMRHMRGALSEP